MSSDPKQLLRQILDNLPLEGETRKDAERGIEKMTDEQAIEVSRKLNTVLKGTPQLFRFRRKKDKRGQNSPPSAER